MEERRYKQVAFYNFGCKLNFAETSTLARMFQNRGYQWVSFKDGADVYVINTCCVTQAAEKKCRQTISSVRRKAPESIIVVVGCYVQLKSQYIQTIEGVDLVLGSGEKWNMLFYIEQMQESSNTPLKRVNDFRDLRTFHASYSSGEDRTRSFLKIQDGCDYWCSYCVIPMTRGRSRNASIGDIIENARAIAHNGVREIVLTGVNIGDFGKTTGESFYQLLQELIKVPGIERYRISSTEPDLLTDQIIQLVKDTGKIVPHFHIPLQSGSNKILKMMRRNYSRELFQERLRKIRELLPYAGIGVDVITGFPGENEADFRETYQFLAELDFSYLHVFTYSERPYTRAVNLQPKIDPEVKDYRRQILQKLSEQKQNHFMQRQIDTVRPVLFEHTVKDGKIFGFTDNYIKVETEYKDALAGTIQQVRLNAINPDGIMSVSLK